MRPLLPALAMLLCACSPLATPAPYAPAIARPEQVADAGATSAVAVAAATYAAQQTQTAYSATVQAGAIVGTALAAEAVGTRAAVDSMATHSALTVTAQSVAGGWATGTYQAGAATQTATAAIPAMTATRAAQVVAQERSMWTWVFWMILGAAAFLVVVFGLIDIATRSAKSWCARADAEADRIRANIAPAVLAHQRPALGLEGYIVVMVGGKPHTEILKALGAAIEAGEQEPPEMIDVTPPAHMTKARAELIAFLRDAQRVAGDDAGHIPSASKMGSGGSRWAAQTATLKTLGLARTNGGGLPAAGEYATQLTGRWTLAVLIDALEHGQFVFSPPPAPSA